jgi:pantoate--beta-alanine ligase
VEIVETFREARALRRGTVGFVPTLGFVHEGHLSLIERAALDNDMVLVSLFVNPLQFGPGEDFDAYPRQLERDAALISEAGAKVLFSPSLSEMYPEPALTQVEVPELAIHLDGVERPDHFRGVATIVTKFLAGLQPSRAYFGRKDGQQLAIIQRLVFDLSLPVEIEGCPTVREADGLALSSRNAYLSDVDKAEALALSSGLMAAADLAEAGERRAAALIEAVRDTALDTEFSYVTLMDRRTVHPLEVLTEDAFLAVAARVGPARLIDNIHIDVAGDAIKVDRGVRLDRPSVLYAT